MADSFNNLGSYLREMREKSKFSQLEVAKFLGHKTAQSVSDWERNYGSSIPIPALKALIKLYRIPSKKIYEMFLEHHTRILQKNLSEEFFKDQHNSIRKKQRMGG